MTLGGGREKENSIAMPKVILKLAFGCLLSGPPPMAALVAGSMAHMLRTRRIAVARRTLCLGISGCARDCAHSHEIHIILSFFLLKLCTSPSLTLTGKHVMSPPLSFIKMVNSFWS